MKVFLSLLILAASAYCAPTTVAPTTVDPTGSTPPPTHDDWAHFHRQVQVQVFQLEASLHELQTEAALPLHAGHVVVLQHIIARDEAMVATIQKEVEAEAKHNLSDTEKAFITETTTTLDHVKKQLAKLYETLSKHKNTTPSSFEAETVATTAKPKDDFKTFQEHTELSLSHIGTSVAHIEADEGKNRTPEQIAKLKAQVQKDLEEVDKLEKKVEAESKKTLTEEQKTFVTKSADSVKALKARLVTAQEKVGQLVAGTTKPPKETTTAAETTKPAFYAETVTTAKPKDDFKAFQEHTELSLSHIGTSVAHIEADEGKNRTPEQIAKLKAQVQKDLEEVDKLEKKVEAESKKTLTDEQKAFVTKSADSVKALKARLVTAQEKVGQLVAGTTKPPKETTTAAETTKPAFYAETVTTAKPKDDFKAFQEHTELSLSHIGTSVAHIEADEGKNRTPEQIAKLKAQVQKDLEEVDKLEKKVEAESKKTLTDEQKAFVTKSADSVKALKARLVTAQEKVGQLVAGTTKPPKETTTAAETTKPAFFAETATPAVIDPLEWLTFHDKIQKSVSALETEYLQISQDLRLHPTKIQSHSAQIEKALQTIPDIEKQIKTTETTKHLNDKEKAFTKTMFVVLENLKKQFTELEAKVKNTTGTSKATTGTPKATSGTPTTGTPKETVKPSTPKPTSF